MKWKDYNAPLSPSLRLVVGITSLGIDKSTSGLLTTRAFIPNNHKKANLNVQSLFDWLASNRIGNFIHGILATGEENEESN
jgi:hypothetical protein